MHTRERAFYFSLWRDLCLHFGWKSSDSARRYALHQAAGCPQSSKAWGHEDVDRFKQYTADLLAGRSYPGEAMRNHDLTTEEGVRRRLIGRVEEDLCDASLPEGYVVKIITAQAGLGCWRILDTQTLKNLVKTIRNRTYRKLNPDADRRPRKKTPRKPRSTATRKSKKPERIECPF